MAERRVKEVEQKDGGKKEVYQVIRINAKEDAEKKKKN